MPPQGEIQRKRALERARNGAERTASGKIAAILARRQKTVARDLRRFGLRKRFKKSLKETGALYKQGDEFDLDWQGWIDQFSEELQQALYLVVEGVAAVETAYFESRGYRPQQIDPQQIIDAYLSRTGRQITDIGTDTRDGVVSAITDWYNTADDLPTLIDTLGQWFDDSRAEMIARTESTYITSQVSLDMMQQFGIIKCNVNLPEEDWEGP